MKRCAEEVGKRASIPLKLSDVLLSDSDQYAQLRVLVERLCELSQESGRCSQCSG
jgi:hypothetical protein